MLKFQDVSCNFEGKKEERSLRKIQQVNMDQLLCLTSHPCKEEEEKKLLKLYIKNTKKKLQIFKI